MKNALLSIPKSYQHISMSWASYKNEKVINLILMMGFFQSFQELVTPGTRSHIDFGHLFHFSVPSQIATWFIYLTYENVRFHMVYPLQSEILEYFSLNTIDMKG